MPSIARRSKEFSTLWFEIVAKTVVGLPKVSEGEKYYALTTSDYVTILPVTPTGRVLLVRQYRPAVEEYTLELPSGNLELGETPEAAAYRELLEETGCRAETLIPLGSLHPDSGRLTNLLWCFLANVPDSRDGLSAEEGIEVVPVTAMDLRRRILDGTFLHAPHIGIVLLAILQERFRFDSAGV